MEIYKVALPVPDHTIYVAMVKDGPVALCLFHGTMFAFVYCAEPYRRQGYSTTLRLAARTDVGPASGYPRVRTPAALAWGRTLSDLDGNPIPDGTKVLDRPELIEAQERRGERLLMWAASQVAAGKAQVLDVVEEA